MTDKQIIARCKRKPKTAADLGVTIQRLRRLEAKGELARTGTRIQGRGRPAVEFGATA
jgi:predicted ArsR family transcriptional regulator